MLANEMDRDERRSPVAKVVEEKGAEKGDDQPNERVECIEYEPNAWVEC